MDTNGEEAEKTRWQEFKDFMKGPYGFYFYFTIPMAVIAITLGIISMVL